MTHTYKLNDIEVEYAGYCAEEVCKTTVEKQRTSKKRLYHVADDKFGG